MWGRGVRQKEHVLDANVGESGQTEGTCAECECGGKGVRQKEHVLNVGKGSDRRNMC